MTLEQNLYEALRGEEMNNFDGIKITSGPLRLKTELSTSSGASKSTQAL